MRICRIRAYAVFAEYRSRMVWYGEKTETRNREAILELEAVIKPEGHQESRRPGSIDRPEKVRRKEI